MAGGKSSRMGSEKGKIEIGGKALYKYALRILEEICDEILISTCKDSLIEENYLTVCDEVKGIGPLGGIYSCLMKSNTDLNLVLSYDMPNIQPQLFSDLLQYTPDFEIILPALPGKRPEPLCAFYKKSVISSIEKQIDKKQYAVHHLFQLANCYTYILNPSASYFRTDFFRNLNSRNDLLAP